jgi:hypothetical protein
MLSRCRSTDRSIVIWVKFGHRYAGATHTLNHSDILRACSLNACHVTILHHMATDDIAQFPPVSRAVNVPAHLRQIFSFFKLCHAF